MPLCHHCRDEAETVSRGPPPGPFERFLSWLFFSRLESRMARTIETETRQCDECSRCTRAEA